MYSSDSDSSFDEAHNQSAECGGFDLTCVESVQLGATTTIRQQRSSPPLATPRIPSLALHKTGRSSARPNTVSFRVPQQPEHQQQDGRPATSRPVVERNALRALRSALTPRVPKFDVVFRTASLYEDKVRSYRTMVIDHFDRRDENISTASTAKRTDFEGAETTEAPVRNLSRRKIEAARTPTIPFTSTAAATTTSALSTTAVLSATTTAAQTKPSFTTTFHTPRNDDLRLKALREQSNRVFDRPYQDPHQTYNMRVQPEPEPPRRDTSRSLKKYPSVPMSVLDFFGCETEEELAAQDAPVSARMARSVMEKTPVPRRPTSARKPVAICNRPRFTAHLHADLDNAKLVMEAAHKSPFVAAPFVEDRVHAETILRQKLEISPKVTTSQRQRMARAGNLTSSCEVRRRSTQYAAFPPPAFGGNGKSRNNNSNNKTNNLSEFVDTWVEDQASIRRDTVELGNEKKKVKTKCTTDL